MRSQSLYFHGGNLFNSLPPYIRNYTGIKDGFKLLMDKFLAQIPDKPLIPGWLPDPINGISGKHSNSIPDWILLLGLFERRIPMDGYTMFSSIT